MARGKRGRGGRGSDDDDFIASEESSAIEEDDESDDSGESDDDDDDELSSSEEPARRRVEAESGPHGTGAQRGANLCGASTCQKQRGRHKRFGRGLAVAAVWCHRLLKVRARVTVSG